MKIHDRRSRDVLRNRHISIIEVEDPYERGEKIVVSRQLRGDPLGRLHAHGQIDQAQYNAGRAFQFDWETAERGARAIDPTKEAVDGGQMPEPITDGQAAARVRLVEIERELGRRIFRVVHAAVIHGMSMEQIAQSESQSLVRLQGNLVRTGLNELAIIYGLSNARRQYSREVVAIAGMTVKELIDVSDLPEGFACRLLLLFGAVFAGGARYQGR
jgi:hypothetical protein